MSWDRLALFRHIALNEVKLFTSGCLGLGLLIFDRSCRVRVVRAEPARSVIHVLVVEADERS